MIDHIAPNDIAAWQTSHAADGPVTVLDVREPGELAVASVTPDGFTLLAIPMGEIPARMAELDRDQPIACLCHHGGRSMRVAQYLAQNGFSHVANITGGIDAWAQQRDPSIPRY